MHHYLCRRFFIPHDAAFHREQSFKKSLSRTSRWKTLLLSSLLLHPGRSKYFPGIRLEFSFVSVHILQNWNMVCFPHCYWLKVKTSFRVTVVQHYIVDMANGKSFNAFIKIPICFQELFIWTSDVQISPGAIMTVASIFGICFGRLEIHVMQQLIYTFPNHFIQMACAMVLFLEEHFLIWRYANSPEPIFLDSFARSFFNVSAHSSEIN